MNKRERNLLIITLVIVGAGLSFRFLIPEDLELGATGGGDLAMERANFQERFDMLEQEQKIRAEYNSIASNLPEKVPGKTAGETFRDELFNLLTTQLGVQTPNTVIRTYRPIENVDDYYFVEVEVLNIRGELRAMIDLLKNMERQGLLIRNFELKRVGRGGRGSEQIELTTLVARLVKHDDESRRLIERTSPYR